MQRVGKFDFPLHISQFGARGIKGSTAYLRLSPSPVAADVDRARCRLRRHRHQPAVRDAGVLLRLAPGAAHARERARRALADHLRAGAGHLDQVRRDRHACRQPGRRRHPGAHRARARAQRRTRCVGEAGRGPAGPDRARHLRNGTAVWRRDDHAGDLRAQRGRRTRSRHAAVSAVCRAAHRGDSGRLCSSSRSTARTASADSSVPSSSSGS